VSAATPPGQCPPGRDSSPAPKRCSGPCARQLPLSSFGVAAGRRDGYRSECKECRRARRGPRGKEGRRARALERELLGLLGTYNAPPLAEILSRALNEVRQIGAAGAEFAAQVRAVERAIVVSGCRLVDEIEEDAKLSRWAVDRALKHLLAGRVIETRDSYRLEADAEESGRPPVEYHPVGYLHGEGSTRLLRRRAGDSSLL